MHKLRLGVDCSGLSDHIVNKNGELVLYSGESYNKLHEEEIAKLEEKVSPISSPSFSRVRPPTPNKPGTSVSLTPPFPSFPNVCFPQANEVAKELEECRKVVPQKILEQLERHLTSVRPSAEIKPQENATATTTAAAAAEEEIGRENEAAGPPSAKRVKVVDADPADLKTKLSSAWQRMPEIRAKIEEAVARTDRVIRAIEFEASKSGQEANLKTLLGGEGGGEDGEGDEDRISPALKEAEVLGHVSVRKKWAKLMNFSTPIKFSLKDAR